MNVTSKFKKLFRALEAKWISHKNKEKWKMARHAKQAKTESAGLSKSQKRARRKVSAKKKSFAKVSCSLID